MLIEDYALVGDCETAALVGRDGSVDWLCLPRFDSGACFAALLGSPEHGRWLMAPAGEVRRVRRRYRPGTLVLETEFETDEGAVTLIDFMPPRRKNPDLVRIVVGLRGQVRMTTELVMRFDYGSIIPWVRKTEARTAGHRRPRQPAPEDAGGCARQGLSHRRRVHRRPPTSGFPSRSPGTLPTGPWAGWCRPTRNWPIPSRGGGSGPTDAPSTGRGAMPSSAR